MRLYHYSILFMILFFGIMAMHDAGELLEKKRAQERQELDRSVDTAVDAAAEYLAVYSDGRLRIDCEEVLEVFLGNCFAALGILDCIPEQERLKEYMTCMIIVDADGYFLWHAIKEEGTQKTAYVWEEKAAFSTDNREKELEAAVLSAVLRQEELRGFEGGEYRLELPGGEGMLKRGMGGYSVFVLLRGIPEENGKEAYEHFAFSGAALYKIKK